MKKAMLITALVASMAGAAMAQPMFGSEAPGSFWYHSPNDLGARIDFLAARIDRMKTDGRIDANAYRIDRGEIVGIKNDYMAAAARGGGRVTPEDQMITWRKLKEISDRIHWQANWGY